MEIKLIEQKIKISGYHEMYETTIKYPEDLEFYYTPGEIGKCKHVECEHYYAIFEKSRYSEEIINEILNSIWCISKREFGDYIILIVKEVHNDTPLPNISRDEYFKKYNIDFSKYTAVLYTEDMYVANLARIVNFKNPYRIDTLSITTKNLWDSSRKILQMGKDTIGLSAMMLDTSSQTFSKYKVEVLNNNENGDIIWNIALRDAMKEFGYNPDVLNHVEDESKYDLDLKYEKEHEVFKLIDMVNLGQLEQLEQQIIKISKKYGN